MRKDLDDLTYDVSKYNISNLRKILLDTSLVSEVIVDEKFKSGHFKYLLGYLDKLNAESILVEYNYIDRDYLEDFAAYYVRSYYPYRKVCVRLHFFSSKFGKKDITELLTKQKTTVVSGTTLDTAYLGFIVIKPLSSTIIGRTCLATYPDKEGRKYPAIRTYGVNLMGLPLGVDSMAYMQQDSVLAACASSALWSCFHITGKLFQHEIISPVHITKAATDTSYYAGRQFPNEGLTAEQMAAAIRHIHLEPYITQPKTYKATKSAIYGYIKNGFPLIMGIGLYEESDTTHPKLMGLHAVTINGIIADEKVPIGPNHKDEIELRSSRITKVLVHDDQIGPFARMKFDGIPLKFQDISRPEVQHEIQSIDSSWTDSKGNIGKVRATVLSLIVPLYHKIRIPYDTVLNIVENFNKILISLDESLPDTALKLPLFEWDISLTTVQKLKSDIFESKDIDPEVKQRLLERGLPKYIWKATMKTENDEEIDFLFDATDIEQGFIFFDFIERPSLIAFLLKLHTISIRMDQIRLLPVKEMFARLNAEKS